MFFVLFFINIKTRKVYITGATQYPNQEWVNKHTRNILPFLNDNKSGRKMLIRDRDKKFSAEFDGLFKNHEFTVQKMTYPHLLYTKIWVFQR